MFVKTSRVLLTFRIVLIFNTRCMNKNAIVFLTEYSKAYCQKITLITVTQTCSYMSNCWWFSIGSDNCLISIRWQAIAWTSNCPTHGSKYTSLDVNEINKVLRNTTETRCRGYQKLVSSPGINQLFSLHSRLGFNLVSLIICIYSLRVQVPEHPRTQK